MLIRYIKFLASFPRRNLILIQTKIVDTTTIRSRMMQANFSQTPLLASRPIDSFSHTKPKFSDEKYSFHRDYKSATNNTYSPLPWLFSFSRRKNNPAIFLFGLGALIMTLTSEFVEAKEDKDKGFKDKMSELVLEGVDKIKLVKGQDIILVIGGTGAGKSTLVNYLLDCDMALVDEGNGVRMEAVDQAFAKMGTNPVQSETRHPGVYQSADGHIYVDCPGFFDTRGEEEEIWGRISKQLVVKLARRIKGVVVVVEETSLVGDKVEGIAKISGAIAELFINPLEIMDSLLLVVTKAENRLRPLTERAVENLVAAKIKALQEGRESIKRKYGHYEPHMDEQYQPHVVKYDIPFPDDQNPEKAEDGKKWREINQKLNILRAFGEAIQRQNLVIANFLKKNEKEKITSKLDELKPISSEDLALDEHSSKNLKFNSRFVDVIVSEGVKLFNQQEDLTININNFLTEINFLEGNIRNLKENLHDATVTSNATLARHYKQQIDKIEEKIRVIAQRKSELERTGETIALYFREPFYEKRAWYGWLGWSLHKFSYKDIPFHRIVRKKKDDTFYDDKGQDPTGYFEQEIKDESKGIYEGVYKSLLGKDGDAIVEVFVKEKDKKPFQEEVRQLDDELKVVKSEKSVLEKHHAATFLTSNKEAAIAEYTTTRESKITELESSRRNIAIVTGEIDQNFPLFIAVNEIIGIMNYNQNLTIRFSERLTQAETYVRHADQFILPRRHEHALKYYKFALKYDRNNIAALEGCARSLVALKLPEKADVYYSSALQQAEEHDQTQKQEIELERKKIQSLVELRPSLNWSILNPAIYCGMSELAYCDDPDEIKRNETAKQIYESLPKGWEILTTSKQGTTKAAYNRDDYFAMVFRHEKTKQIVIAHRGTKKAGSLRADRQLILSEFPAQFTYAAAPFTQEIVARYPGYEISHTGHSLGGSLAALCAYSFCSTSAVAFEPFGIQSILNVHTRKKNLDPVHFDALPVTTYLSGPNIVNTAAGHVGLIFQVCPNTQSTSLTEITYHLADDLAKLYIFSGDTIISQEMIKDIVKYHSLSKIRPQFDIETGFPTMMRLVRSWVSNSNNYATLFSKCPENLRDFIDPRSLNGGIKAHFIDDLKFDVTDYHEYRIKLTHFDENTRQLIVDLCENKPVRIHKDIVTILSHCTIEDGELVIPDQSIKAIELKLYLEKTSHLQQLRECHDRRVPITREPPSPPPGPGSQGFFQQHGSTILGVAAVAALGIVATPKPAKK